MSSIAVPETYACTWPSGVKAESPGTRFIRFMTNATSNPLSPGYFCATRFTRSAASDTVAETPSCVISFCAAFTRPSMARSAASCGRRIISVSNCFGLSCTRELSQSAPKASASSRSSPCGRTPVSTFMGVKAITFSGLEYRSL